MTHGTYLTLSNLVDNKIKAGTATAADAEKLYDAQDLLNQVSRLNFADELIVEKVEQAKALVDQSSHS